MFFSAKTKDDIDNLIANGADINAQDSFFGQTYLHILVQSGSSLFDYFLSKGPDTNIQNKSGQTPIYYAKDVFTIEKLIKYGASILVRDINGKTPSEANYQLMSSFITYYSNNIKNKLVA
jgi:ankyrin repeat protein